MELSKLINLLRENVAYKTAIRPNSPPGFHNILKNMCELALWYIRLTNKSPDPKRNGLKTHFISDYQIITSISLTAMP